VPGLPLQGRPLLAVKAVPIRPARVSEHEELAALSLVESLDNRRPHHVPKQSAHTALGVDVRINAVHNQAGQLSYVCGLEDYEEGDFVDTFMAKR
jgi:hypothetical protein